MRRRGIGSAELMAAAGYRAFEGKPSSSQYDWAIAGAPSFILGGRVF